MPTQLTSSSLFNRDAVACPRAPRLEEKTHVYHRRLAAAAIVGLNLASLASAARAEDQTVTIAYQTGFSPWTLAVASGNSKKFQAGTFQFRRFNSGAEISQQSPP